LQDILPSETLGRPFGPKLFCNVLQCSHIVACIFKQSNSNYMFYLNTKYAENELPRGIDAVAL